MALCTSKAVTLSYTSKKTKTSRSSLPRSRSYRRQPRSLRLSLATTLIRASSSSPRPGLTFVTTSTAHAPSALCTEGSRFAAVEKSTPSAKKVRASPPAAVTRPPELASS